MLESAFLTKLPTLGVLFSRTIRGIVLTKLVLLGISPLTPFILPLRIVLLAKLNIWDILPSIFFILAFCASFLTTSFLLHYLAYLNQQQQLLLIYEYLIYLLYFSNCFNYLVFFNWCTLYFKLGKKIFLEKDDA